MKNSKVPAANLFLSLLLFTGYGFAQVPVRQEPRHHVVLENDYVRLIEVYIRPHDTTLTHIHAAPSVIVFLSRSTTGSQVVGGAPSVGNVVPGQTSYAAYDEKPVSHRVWNQGDSIYHVMDIELAKKEPVKDSCDIISQAGFQLQIVKKLVHVYTINLAAHESYQISGSSCAHLLIDISGEVSAGKHTLSPGKFYFFPPQIKMEISSPENAKCVLLELK